MLVHSMYSCEEKTSFIMVTLLQQQIMKYVSIPKNYIHISLQNSSKNHSETYKEVISVWLIPQAQK